MSLKSLFIAPEKINGVFAKVPTPNDDSGRHGVVIPVAAHAFFPSFPGFVAGAATNYTVPIRTLWRAEGGVLARVSSYKHYHRYPERRLTALRSPKLNAAPAGTLTVVGRRSDEDKAYEVHVLYPDDQLYDAVRSELGFKTAESGEFVALQNWAAVEHASELPEVILELQKTFDALKAEGYVPTLRTGGSRGVGNTFEIRMGGTENNVAGADYKGVEFKSMIRSEFKKGTADDTDLFLKEPTWTDGISDRAERVRQYGYVDSDGRDALYSGVKVRQNSHGFALKVDRPSKRLLLTFKGDTVGCWSFDTLQRSLEEKLKDTLYALAECRRSGGKEEYYYHTLFYLSGPSVEAMLNIIEEGGVSLQLRMHVRANGAVRNHGSQFRVSMGHWPKLYAAVRTLRRSGAEA